MRCLQRTRFGAVALVAQLTLASAAHAQFTTGSVAGTVRDAQGGVIPGATVISICDRSPAGAGAPDVAGAGPVQHESTTSSVDEEGHHG